MTARVNIVGGGKVGRVFGRVLAAGGAFAVQDVLARSQASADQARQFIGSGRALCDLAAMRPADLWVLAVGDDQIEPVCAQLAQSVALGGSVMFHCSGAKAASALQAAAAAGALTASVHPIRSFADPEQVAQQFAGTFCGIEGDARALAMLEPVLAALGARPVAIDAGAKTVYHAASVFASNYLVTLLDAALRAYQAAGIDEAVARQLAAPLAAETLANVMRLGAPAALTGPIARGDMATVARQHAALAAWHAPTGALYGALADATLPLARRTHDQES